MSAKKNSGSLNQDDLERAIRGLARGKIDLDKNAFVEGSGNRWYVGREGLDPGEPDSLSAQGEWDGKGAYFPTALEALAHAKKHGHSPKSS